MRRAYFLPQCNVRAGVPTVQQGSNAPSSCPHLNRFSHSFRALASRYGEITLDVTYLVSPCDNAPESQKGKS